MHLVPTISLSSGEAQLPLPSVMTGPVGRRVRAFRKDRLTSGGLLFLLLFWLGLCPLLAAKELNAYHVGEAADRDIVTPVALDVADAAATAELRAAKARQHPAVFRSFPGATNLMRRDFQAAFDRGHALFMAELTNEFPVLPVDEMKIASSEFGRLVTAFGVENKDFPIPDELAAEWARGKDGLVIETKILAVLGWSAGRLVQPDTLPEGMTVGDLVRLVPVTEPDQKLAYEDVQAGPLVATTNLVTLTNVRALFRREFSGSQQLFGRALAAFIQPNCLPDAPFTELTRGTSVYQVVVSDHLDAGETIVRKGDVIDVKAKAALVALDNALKAGTANAPVPAAPSVTSPSVTSPAVGLPAAGSPHPQSGAAVLKTSLSPTNKPAAAAVAAPTGFLQLAPITILVGLLVSATLAGIRKFLQRRKQKAAGALAVVSPPGTMAVDAKGDLAPQVAQVVREAVQQELAAQRRELLLTQQAATEEISALVRRLDQVQMPLQERVKTYEDRIRALETELAQRTEENRELLKLKIELIGRQMQAEQAKVVAGTVTASS
jgi:hypothetical protein